MKPERHYQNKWGFGLKDILSMPRKQFCEMYGERYMHLSASKFKKVIIRETPYSGNGPTVPGGNFVQDSLSSKKLCDELREGFAYDEVSFLI